MSSPSTSALRRPGLSVNWSTIWDGIALADPDRTAVVVEERRISFGALEDLAARLAGWLQQHGVERGDRVACLLPNRPEYVITVYAAMKLGAVPVNLNHRYGSAELQHVLGITRPKVVVVASSLRDRLREAMPASTPTAMPLVVQDDVAASQDALFDEAVTAQRADGAGRSGDDLVFLLTGGTTGMPRAVVYRHAVVLDSQLTSAYGTLGIEFPHDVAEAVAVATDSTLAHPVTLPITPLMHAMAFFNAMNTLLTGGSLVFLNTRRFDPARTLDAIVAHGVSRLIIAGDAVAVPLVEELERRPEIRLDSLTAIMSSGMAWGDRSKRALMERSSAELIDILGASEGGPFAMARSKHVDDLPSRLRLLPGAVLLDEAGRELPARPGTVGLLAYRGATPDGYFEDPTRTEAVYRRIRGQRYLVPGDWARWEDDGITMLGRGDAVVNSGGEKVYPAEVEGVLAEHPAVADCIVFGLPDERWGEIVAAAVALRVGRTATAEELQDHVGARLAGYKKPRHISIGPIDRGATGKVPLGVLRERAIEERAPGSATAARVRW
ncbi:MAG: AMP-binding protein [Acidobacteria bacterium]|nr:AMP-binding protein [Acidobacteriota bacterium]